MIRPRRCHWGSRHFTRERRSRMTLFLELEEVVIHELWDGDILLIVILVCLDRATVIRQVLLFEMRWSKHFIRARCIRISWAWDKLIFFFFFNWYTSRMILISNAIADNDIRCQRWLIAVFCQYIRIDWSIWVSGVCHPSVSRVIEYHY